jgi:hypothetical protein
MGESASATLTMVEILTWVLTYSAETPLWVVILALGDGQDLALECSNKCLRILAEEKGSTRCLIVIVAIIFGTTSRERLVRGLKPTNCDSPAVKSPNNHYEGLNGIPDRREILCSDPLHGVV